MPVHMSWICVDCGQVKSLHGGGWKFLPRNGFLRRVCRDCVKKLEQPAESGKTGSAERGRRS